MEVDCTQFGIRRPKDTSEFSHLGVSIPTPRITSDLAKLHSIRHLSRKTPVPDYNSSSAFGTALCFSWANTTRATRLCKLLPVTGRTIGFVHASSSTSIFCAERHSTHNLTQQTKRLPYDQINPTKRRRPQVTQRAGQICVLHLVRLLGNSKLSATVDALQLLGAYDSIPSTKKSSNS